ncbi:MAG: hypothetical protein WBD55_12650 [Dehalococcoidia bacterium]
MPEDRIQREIEEILDRLDEFVPDRKASGPRPRPTDAAASAGRGLLDSLSGISLGHVMLAAVALIVLSVLARNVQPAFATWVLVAGVILFLTAFALSFVSRGSSQPSVEKRWRGRPIELNEPTFRERIRAWLQAKRHPRQ